MSIIMDTAELIRKMENLHEALCRRAESAVGAVAQDMEVYAKQNAPWTDRTGNARRTLEGFCIRDGGNIHAGVCGNMPYSPDLELLYGGRYAILTPTVDAFSPQIISAAENAMSAYGT